MFNTIMKACAVARSLHYLTGSEIQEIGSQVRLALVGVTYMYSKRLIIVDLKVDNMHGIHLEFGNLIISFPGNFAGGGRGEGGFEEKMI